MYDIDLFSLPYGTQCDIAKRVRKVCLVASGNIKFPSHHAHNPQVMHQPKSALPHLWHPEKLFPIGFTPRTAVFRESKTRDVHGDVYEQSLDSETKITYESETFCSRLENRTVHALLLMGSEAHPVVKWVSKLRLLDKTDSESGVHAWQWTGKSSKRANYISNHPAFVGTNRVLIDFTPLANNHPYFAIAIDQSGQRWLCSGSVTGEISMKKYNP
jgi:hypothetical protein